MRKLFILGWDNALIEDIVETKIHPSYMARLSELDPILADKWTLENTRFMQGLHPDKIWHDFALLWGNKKAAKAREIFYEAYAHTPQPQLMENAAEFVKKAHEKGCCLIAVSNKMQELLNLEMSKLGISKFFAEIVGTENSIGVVQKIRETDSAKSEFDARCCQIQTALQFVPDIIDVVMVAHAGYAKPAYAVGVPRFEEASPQVFDWLCYELEKQVVVSPDEWEDELL